MGGLSILSFNCYELSCHMVRQQFSIYIYVSLLTVIEMKKFEEVVGKRGEGGNLYLR